MGTFITIFIMFIAMIGLMSVGIMFKRKPIAGSCGGLGNVGIEKACDCDKPCDKRLAKMQAAQQTEPAEQRIDFHK